jgi:hypothetical protein
MAELLLSNAGYRPLNRWDHHRIQPGPVHSVGDAITGIRLKHSHPDLPLRWDKDYSGEHATLMGDNNTDGNHSGFFNDGLGQPYVKTGHWPVYREFRTPLGYINQDLRPPDKTFEPLLSSTPNLKWDRRVAETYKIYRPGFDFLPLPGGFAPERGQIPRGGSVPSVTNVIVPENEVVNTPNHLALLNRGDQTAAFRQNRLLGQLLPVAGRKYLGGSNTRFINSK